MRGPSVADIKSTTSKIKYYKTILNNQDWIHHQHWEDKEILMNIETDQASRTKHEKRDGHALPSAVCWLGTDNLTLNNNGGVA